MPRTPSDASAAAPLTHADLVKRAVKWLRGTRRCCPVLAEFQAVHENPDAIGWFCTGLSVMVECKVSRADFRADAKKPHRQRNWGGLGCERWYMTPAGLLRPEEIPAGWGLLEVHGGRVRQVVKPSQRLADDHRVRQELQVVLMALRRYQLDPAIAGRMPMTTVEKMKAGLPLGESNGATDAAH